MASSDTPLKKNIRVTLRIPKTIYAKLKGETEVYAYNSVQEVILDALREKFYVRPSTATGKKRGRPRKEDPLRILGMKRIFAK